MGGLFRKFTFTVCSLHSGLCSLLSAHTSQVDVQLNSTMHLISGTLHSTPLHGFQRPRLHLTPTDPLIVLDEIDQQLAVSHRDPLPED